MSESRKKPGLAFWATMTFLALLILWPLSWGPQLWLMGSGYVPEWLIWTDHVYDPLRWGLDVAPDWVREPAETYLTWWFAHVDMPYFNPATGEWE